MNEVSDHWGDRMGLFLALAARLEGEGQYNNAKLLARRGQFIAARQPGG